MWNKKKADTVFGCAIVCGLVCVRDSNGNTGLIPFRKHFTICDSVINCAALVTRLVRTHVSCGDMWPHISVLLLIHTHILALVHREDCSLLSLPSCYTVVQQRQRDNMEHDAVHGCSRKHAKKIY